MKKYKKETTLTKNTQKERKNKSIPKTHNQTLKTKSETKKIINSKKDPNINTLQSQINNFKQIIEEKNREIEFLKNENRNNLSSNKQSEFISNENKVEKINKKLDLIKVRNDILTKNLKDKEQEILDLNNIILEYKQKIESNEQSSNFINEIKKNIRDENAAKQIEKYEIELNKIKNKLDESEIKNKKLLFENNILADKIKNIELDKNEEIRINESLHQKQIDNYNKNISELNEKIKELIQEKETNKNENINKDEYINKKDIINELNKKQDKIRQLDEDNFKLKKEMQQMINKNDELTIIIKNKDLIIEKLETEIEKFDFQEKNKSGKENELNNEKYKNIEENLEKIEILEKENEELRLGLQNMTEGVNKANELYNEKLNSFHNELLLKNNKLNEYKNKISILKSKINELSNELILIKGGANNNSYYNASFINNSIINTNPNANTITKYKNDMINNNLMLNKKYYNNYSTNRGNTAAINANKVNNPLGEAYIQNINKKENNNNQINNNYYNMSKFRSLGSLNKINENNNINNSNSNTNIYRNKLGLNNAVVGSKTSDTQDFINKNKEEDQNHMNFLKEYRETLDKFQSFK